MLENVSMVLRNIPGCNPRPWQIRVGENIRMKRLLLGILQAHMFTPRHRVNNTTTRFTDSISIAMRMTATIAF